MEKGIKNGHGFLKCTLGTSCDHLLASCQFLVHYLIFCLEENYTLFAIFALIKHEALRK